MAARRVIRRPAKRRSTRRRVKVMPFVVPTSYVRVDDKLFIHGSAASRMLRSLSEGISVCVTVTLIDGLVLARSAFHHSINYRSVVIIGVATALTNPDEKLAALRAFTEHVIPGRWADVREPNDQELKATTVLSLPLAEVSAKIRTGGGDHIRSVLFEDSALR